MHRLTRRTFLRTSGTAVAVAAIPSGVASATPSGRTTTAMVSGRPADPVYSIDASELKPLMTRALDAARNAGATYADVRLHVVYKEEWHGFMGQLDTVPGQTYTVDVGIGVRALFNGYWGFGATHGAVAPDDVVRLGQTATAQAKSAARGKTRTVELAPTSPTADGRWQMPVDIDPFTVTAEEKIDFIGAVRRFYHRQRFGLDSMIGISFLKEERAFASTDGTFVTQTLFNTSGSLALTTAADWMNEERGSVQADFLTPAGAGWEYLLRAPFRDRADELIDTALRARRKTPVDIGRYDIVFDALATAHLLDATIGAATELHRAHGYWANDGGTSFISAPLSMLGTLKLGATPVTVGANRSLPGGAATVKWDDEGVLPDECTLVTNGVLTDFQTTRESAGWLLPYYQRVGKPFRSHGHSGSDDVMTPPSQGAPNLTLAPAANDLTFADLVANTKKGYAVLGGMVSTDQQCLTGWGRGNRVFKIENGTMTQAVRGSQYLFRTPEFWNSVTALGGTRSVRHIGIERRMTPRTAHTLSVVPIAVTNVAVAELRPNSTMERGQ